jgi:hypothetical protein
MVKKRQTVLNESLDSKVLSLYAIGMSYQLYFWMRCTLKYAKRAK